MESTRVTADEVKERMARGEPFTFVDTRNPQAWGEATTKLPGAIRVPADEVDAHLSEIPKDRTVITYCTWPNEASSARAAQELLDKSWKNVHPLYGGFDAWQQAGLPVDPKWRAASIAGGNWSELASVHLAHPAITRQWKPKRFIYSVLSTLETKSFTHSLFAALAAVWV